MFEAMTVVNSSFSEIIFYEHFFVHTPQEGSQVKSEQVKELAVVVEDFYKEPYVAIADRVHPVSVFLTHAEKFFEVMRQTKVVGLALVVHDNIAHIAAENIKALNPPIETKIFTDLDRAKVWAEELALQSRE